MVVVNVVCPAVAELVVDVVCPVVAVLDLAFAGDADDADLDAGIGAGVGICVKMVEPLVAREENDGPVER